ncbi:hypothetical protein FB45DRAFT_841639 [Roridomyces roridus]|uniref:Uncharacterized protein n=1 Tax=Roridomyces roridus TaxID=1738132 RepID=A0AAD7FEQ8_9AGAR|nr:hypothetical protein FB45DRAFT_841639 [Roridomyces roridus]
MDYCDGLAPIVTTFGPGNLHHLAYSGGISGMQAVTGFLSTSTEGASYFLLGYSYYYAGFAFYWDGAGEAFFRLGNSTAPQAVGNSWTNATGVPENGEIILGLNVASTAASAANRGDATEGNFLVYRIPDNFNDLD